MTARENALLLDRAASASDKRMAVQACLEALASEVAAMSPTVSHVEALRDELDRRQAEALEVARQFEQEAAARTEAEQIAAQLEADRRHLAARADELEARLAEALDAAGRVAAPES